MKLMFLLILLCVAVFAGMTLFVPDQEAFFNEYGFSGQNAIHHPWVILTSLFLHGDLEHLLANVFVLLFFGIAVENELGSVKMGLIFLLGGIAGELVTIPLYGFDMVGIGASAGVFALIGVGMLVKPMDLSFYPFLMPVPILFLGALYILYNFYGFFFDTNSMISYGAHFGGIVVGLLFGLHIRGYKKGILLLLAALIGLAIAFVALLYMH